MSHLFELLLREARKVSVFALRHLGSAYTSVPSVAGIFIPGIRLFCRFTFLFTLSGITQTNWVEPEELQVLISSKISEEKVLLFPDLDIDHLVKEGNVGVVSH